ncbi:MAG TPA: ABC transporter ATP-binding protein [Candidatus Acidoferrum sp.]|nr:ABC transporter ATP-binding protein [Candidatus Acidoferrum sp.]
MSVIMETQGVYKAFGGLMALNQVDVKIEGGKISGLIGPNGAGKTTLFNVLSGFITPDRGRVLFKNRDICGEDPYKIVHLGLARSWQGLRLFENLTVLENVAMSLPRGKEEGALKIILGSWVKNRRKVQRATEILELVQMKSRAQVPVKELSYAEQKLVAIARLLATEAEVLLLDEPTSGLDEKTVNLVIAPLLKELVAQRGKTICLVEHSIKLVFNMCDWVFCLNEGQVAASGRPLELRQDEELNRVFFQTI